MGFDVASASSLVILKLSPSSLEALSYGEVHVLFRRLQLDGNFLTGDSQADADGKQGSLAVMASRAFDPHPAVLNIAPIAR
jgi:hypothetical protein